MGEPVDLASEYPYFREKYFSSRPFYRHVREFVILRVIEHGGTALTGKDRGYETIYEIKSLPSGEVFLVSAEALGTFFHPGELHPKIIIYNSEPTRLSLELEARLRKKYLDDYGINTFIVNMISLYGKWSCDDAVTKK